jgi:4-hydroxybenzoate polyprenyltransferase
MLLAAVLWAGVYDTYYAMADRADDARIGVRSTAISFGDMDLPMIGAMQAMMLLALLLIGRSLQLGGWFYLGLAAGAMLLGFELWTARTRDRHACLRAFQRSHWFGLAVLAGIALNFGWQR